MATTVIVAVLSTVFSLLFEGRHGVLPIPPNEYRLQLVNASYMGVNGTVYAEEYAFSHYGGGIQVFCLEEHCVWVDVKGVGVQNLSVWIVDWSVLYRRL